MKPIFQVLCLLLLSTTSNANFSTPGTGVKWSLNDLVINSAGDVTAAGGSYYINDTVTISTNDTLLIATDETVKFYTATYLSVKGSLLIDPPTGVLFTAQDISTRYLGVWFDFAGQCNIRKLTFEYANSFRIADCSPVIDQCIFRYNSPVTTFGNSAITLFRSKPVITNCQFLDNQRAAISGGANISNAPLIMNCLFMGNNTLNQNVPQINLGTTGADTAKILNNQILRASTNSGGIGFLPIGNVQVLIKGNLIRNNRYGITLNGGSNISSIISYNLIDSNNTQNNPSLGGSGIAFSGGTAPQNSIVTGNVFRFNLWGITIQNASAPNLGNLSNADTTDDGKNWFINNTNSTTPGIDLYNNSTSNISAQNNYWNTDDPAVIESRIFHQPDNASLGLVNYSNFMVIPVRLIKFSGSRNNGKSQLNWTTSGENSSRYFSIERSLDGRNFQAVADITAAGMSSGNKNYHFEDLFSAAVIYYRLKLVDVDGQFVYSPVLLLKDLPVNNALVTSVEPSALAARIELDSDQPMSITIFDASGRLLAQQKESLSRGSSSISIALPTGITAGIYYVRFEGTTLKTTLSFRLTK